MKYKVLVASLYNDENNQAARYEVGSTLNTGLAYGDSLVKDGFVEHIAEEPAAAPPR